MKTILKHATIILYIVVFNCSMQMVNAQFEVYDYSKQVSALQQSFNAKNMKSIKSHLSQAFKIDPLPSRMTDNVLGQIFANFPALNSLEILKTIKGEVRVAYDFDAMGKSESMVLFDTDNKITSIELFTTTIKNQMAQQQAQSKSIAVPTLNKLSKKHSSTQVEFAAEDGLSITGNLYEVSKDKPVILLCHQAGYNSFEYADIAPRLNEMGFNCLAIDQRSGGGFANKPNHTFERAKQKGLSPTMLDAQQDIDAALKFLNKTYHKKVTLWGSSYSSNLIFFVANKNKSLVNATISFSPGDYFGDKKESLTTIIPKLQIPFFITSSKQESQQVQKLLAHTNLKNNQVHFTPQSEGFHGSKALWEGQKGAQEYWEALTEFLKTIK